MNELDAIGILTSGGDCGGLNAVIKGASQMARSLGIRLYAIKNGYAGLYNFRNSENCIFELKEEDEDSIDISIAGSRIGNTRVKISSITDPDKYARIKESLNAKRISSLIIAGGDDTACEVVNLNSNGIQCVHVPKTMDLDLQTYSVGGDSAINNVTNMIKAVKTTGMSHNRVIIVEVFGRYSGHIAFLGGIAGEADCILIPEVQVDYDVIYAHMKHRFLHQLKTNKLTQSTYIIVVAEGLDINGTLKVDESYGQDAFGHKKMMGSGKCVHEELAKRIKGDKDFENTYKQLGLFIAGMNTGPEIRELVPGYLIRSGVTSAFDACFGLEAGAAAVKLIEKGTYGVTVVGINRGKIVYADTKKIVTPRYVEKTMISLYEQLGICFGRKPLKIELESEKLDTICWNYR